MVETAPGHVEAVRSLVFDPLTQAQRRQLGVIGERIMGAVDPSARCLEHHPLISGRQGAPGDGSGHGPVT